MEKIILNTYRYVLEDVCTKKLIHVDEIVCPKKKVKPASQNPGGFGDASHQRSVLIEVTDDSSSVDLNKNMFSSLNPICKKLLAFESDFQDVEQFKVVIEDKGSRKVKEYKILNKQRRKEG